MTIVRSAGDTYKSQKSGPYRDKSKPVDIRTSNIGAAKGNYFSFSSSIFNRNKFAKDPPKVLIGFIVVIIS